MRHSPSPTKTLVFSEEYDHFTPPDNYCKSAQTGAFSLGKSR